MDTGFHGDLADVVRGGGADSRSNFPVDIPLQPWIHELSNTPEGWGDPFSSMKDHHPLLPELDGIFGHGSSPACSTSFTETMGGGFIAGEIGDETVASCSGGDALPPAFRISTNDVMFKPSSPTVSFVVDTTRAKISSPRNPIMKKRKRQTKKVVCIPAPTAANGRQGVGEVVPSDMWAWRKYGQKPIKGSPYPRGYYRCSSSKGCSARKQVDRSQTDPNMLVITYTSEHNHPCPTQRNALAGSTRISTTTTTTSSSKPTLPPLPPPAFLPHRTASVKEENDHHHNHIEANITNNFSTKCEPGLGDETSVTDSNRSRIEPENVETYQLMNQMMFGYDESYRPLMQDEVLSEDKDLFADLTKLEADPLSMLDLDPFSSLLDWSSNRKATTTCNSNTHENS